MKKSHAFDCAGKSKTKQVVVACAYSVPIQPHQARFGRGQLASAVDHAAFGRTRCTLGVMALTG